MRDLGGKRICFYLRVNQICKYVQYTEMLMQKKLSMVRYSAEEQSIMIGLVHICVSERGLISSARRQVITWIDDDLLSIAP